MHCVQRPDVCLNMYTYDLKNKTMKPLKCFVCLLLVALSFGACRPEAASFSVKDTGKSLDYMCGDSLLFSYNYATVYPPVGVDSVYKRSGFIHPLRTMSGETLTNCSPVDHRHHFGLWYAWTKTTFEGKEIDFWNLYKKQGTVRFRRFEQVSDNGFTATLDHVAYPDSSAEKTAMTETLTVRLGRTECPGYYIDYRTTLRCAGSSPVTLEAYRYGGFCLRTRPDWNGQTSEMLTSEGAVRDSADGSHARWCYLQGQAGAGYASLLVVPSADNLNYPEPLRVWPSNANLPAGDVMWNFSPTKEQPFTLRPGAELTLAYRVYVLEERLDADAAARLAGLSGERTDGKH